MCRLCAGYVPGLERSMQNSQTEPVWTKAGATSGVGGNGLRVVGMVAVVIEMGKVVDSGGAGGLRCSLWFSVVDIICHQHYHHSTATTMYILSQKPFVGFCLLGP